MSGVELTDFTSDGSTTSSDDERPRSSSESEESKVAAHVESCRLGFVQYLLDEAGVTSESKSARKAAVHNLLNRCNTVDGVLVVYAALSDPRVMTHLTKTDYSVSAVIAFMGGERSVEAEMLHTVATKFRELAVGKSGTLGQLSEAWNRLEGRYVDFGKQLRDDCTSRIPSENPLTRQALDTTCMSAMLR